MATKCKRCGVRLVTQQDGLEAECGRCAREQGIEIERPQQDKKTKERVK